MSGTYPDWLSYPQWIGTQLVSDPNFVLGATSKNYGAFDVTGWRAVMLLLAVTAGTGAKLEITYRPLPPGSNYNHVPKLACLNGQKGALVVENIATSLDHITVTGVGAGCTVTVGAFAVNLDQQIFSDDDTHNMLYLTAQPIGAGATVTKNLPPFRGIAQTIFRSSGPAMAVTLDSVQNNGVNILGRLLDQPATTGFTLQHPVQAQPMIFTIVNSGAIATYNLATSILDY